MINLLTPYVNQAVSMVYSNDLSMVELLSAVTSKVNELIEADNAYFSVDLLTNLRAILTGWQTDGTLTVIINEALQTQFDALENVVDELDTSTTAAVLNLQNVVDELDTSTTAAVLNLQNQITAIPLPTAKLSNKKIAVMGDSIALGVSNNNTYVGAITWPKKFSDITGCILTNLAVSGTSATKYGNVTEDPNSLTAMIDKTDLSQFDYLMIAFGTNDYGNNIPLGDDTINVNTFKGAYHYAFSYLSTTYPNLKVIALTPIYGLGQLVRNTAGLYRDDYTDAIQQVANRWNIPCIDLTHELGINYNNYQALYYDHSWHPTEATYARIGEHIAHKFPGKAGITPHSVTSKPITLQSGSIGAEAVCYQVDMFQFCRMFGNVVATSTSNATAFTLPVHACPPYGHTFPITTIAGVPSFVSILPDGQVKFSVGSATYDLATIPAFFVGTIDML